MIQDIPPYRRKAWDWGLCLPLSVLIGQQVKPEYPETVGPPTGLKEELPVSETGTSRGKASYPRTCRAAGVRGMWPNVAASVCDAVQHDDDLSLSDRSTAGEHRESSVCAAKLRLLQPDLSHLRSA